jgi:5-guanidino-2-oxopentanoate decarboxylase
VWNNDALSAIVEQMDQRQIPRIGVEPKSPDFLRLAESLGCHAARAASAKHLAQSLNLRRARRGSPRPLRLFIPR